MKARKIFLGVRIPKEVAKRLGKRMEVWKDLPLRLTKGANLHVTLLFIGFRYDEDIVLVAERLRELAPSIETFDLLFDRIALFPEEGKNARSLLWYTGPESEELLALYNCVREVLDISDAPRKSFRPHITLARVRKEKWDALPEKPNLESSWTVSVPVSSLVLFESVFSKEEGLHYETLEEFLLEGEGAGDDHVFLQRREEDK